MVSEIKEIAECISIIFASFAVIGGVGAWRREFVGKRKIEIAEDTFAAFFAVKDAIRRIRDPFSTVGEGSTRKKVDGENSEEGRLRDQGYVVVERYSKNEDIFAEFSKLKYRFMAVYGAETAKIFTEVFQSINSIFISAHMLANHHWKRHGRIEMSGEEWQQQMDDMRRHERIFWDYQEDDSVDLIRSKLKIAEQQLEIVTAPAFRQYGSATELSWWRSLLPW